MSKVHQGKGRELHISKLPVEVRKLSQASRQKECRSRLDHGAVEFIPQEEAQQIAKEERILQTRFVNVGKTDAMRGTKDYTELEREAKSRLVVLVLQVPDALEGTLSLNAPTLTMEGTAVIGQVYVYVEFLNGRATNILFYARAPGYQPLGDI